MEDKRFDLGLTGNAHEPHGCLTPFQLALLYNNEEAAEQLIKKEDLWVLLAESSKGINAVQFAVDIGKEDVLDRWVRKLFQFFDQENLCGNILGLDLSNPDEMNCGPFFGCS